MTAKKRAIIIIAAALVILAAVAVPLSLYFTGIIDYAEPARGDFDTAYLMAYFTGNEPEEERIYFALSRDGYNFTPAGEGPVLQSTTGTGSVRDPYIFAMNDGTYCIIATDMRSELGWSSNHAFTVFKSDDLINWTEYNVDIEPLIPDTVRAWAPQAVWDEEKGMYMVYWANCTDGEQGWSGTVLWYAYSEDMQSLCSEPRILYAPDSGKDAIDGDIVKAGDTYYLYYKDENEAKICLAASRSLTEPYEYEGVVSLYNTNVEGNCIYNVAGTGEWVMMLDCYSSGKFVMQQTGDMRNFKRVAPYDYELDFSPRHGSVMAISADTAQGLEEAFS